MLNDQAVPERLAKAKKQDHWMNRIGTTLTISKLFFACILVSATVFAQTNPKSKSDASVQNSLSKPKDMGSSDFRMFKEEQKLRFALVTSWILGEKKEGMFRYKLRVDVPNEDPAILLPDKRDESAERLLNRVARCAVSLMLYDKDAFILRRHEIPFIRGVDEQARLSSLFANDTFQMSAQEYQEFTNSGSWSVLWSCFP